MQWTSESISRLTDGELMQLRKNAGGLGVAQIVALCDSALLEATRRVARTGQREAKKPRLIPRRDAFEKRGVFSDCLTNWGGIRSSDDTIVMSIWADDIRSENGACSYLLWAPNENGSRPWSDKPGGKERLKHCVLAAESGRAEGLLVYGERLEGRFPEDKATTVSGVDPAVVLEFRVEHRGQEYWAVWGSRPAYQPTTTGRFA
jgi:hypothetical protein